MEAKVAVRTMVTIWPRVRSMLKQEAMNTAHTP